MVDSWNVRCYNDAGYEEELTVQDTEVYFAGIDPTTTYTVEVTAVGMTQSSRISISANPINIVGLNVDESDPQQMTVSWDYTGENPEGGWLLMYSVDGAEMPTVIKSDTSNAVIAPRIPEADYRFTIQAANGASVISNVREFTAGAAQPFEDFNLNAADVTAHLVPTPQQEHWRFEDLGEAAFASNFMSGDDISVILQCSESFYLPGEEVGILYVIRDAHGNVLRDFTQLEHVYWKDIWNGGDAKTGELDLPNTPTIPGSYSLGVFVNGKAMANLEFTIN